MRCVGVFRATVAAADENETRPIENRQAGAGTIRQLFESGHGRAAIWASGIWGQAPVVMCRWSWQLRPTYSLVRRLNNSPLSALLRLQRNSRDRNQEDAASLRRFRPLGDAIDRHRQRRRNTDGNAVFAGSHFQ